jgi:hypothetical protein
VYTAWEAAKRAADGNQTNAHKLKTRGEAETLLLRPHHRRAIAARATAAAGSHARRIPAGGRRWGLTARCGSRRRPTIR